MLFLKLLLSLTLLPTHPLHVTITSLDMDMKTGELIVSSKFFMDDFSLLFLHLYGIEICRDANASMTKKEMELVCNYYSRAFQMSLSDNSVIMLEFAGKEQNEDAIWLRFRGQWPKDVQTRFLLTNKLMLDLYEDQTNLVILSVNGKEKGFTFDQNNQQVTIEFSE